MVHLGNSATCWDEAIMFAMSFIRKYNTIIVSRILATNQSITPTNDLRKRMATMSLSIEHIAMIGNSRFVRRELSYMKTIKVSSFFSIAETLDNGRFDIE